MTQPPIKFQFPEDISLSTNSLIEAWLELRWQLEQLDSTQIARDPGFDMAVGSFYQNVKQRYSYRHALDATKIPADLAPFIVRYQFRTEENGWPLLQIGPGIATVNFTNPYSWPHFQQEATFLRTNLVKSYEQPLKTEALVLRYRNALPFQHQQSSIVDFLSESLNVSVRQPRWIPGDAAAKSFPIGLNLRLAFELRDNIGVGTLTIGSGYKKADHATSQETQIEAVIFDLEVAIHGDNTPSLSNESEFMTWLSLAHRVIHDWYFSLIDGSIRHAYSEEIE